MRLLHLKYKKRMPSEVLHCFAEISNHQSSNMKVSLVCLLVFIQLTLGYAFSYLNFNPNRAKHIQMRSRLLAFRPNPKLTQHFARPGHIGKLPYVIEKNLLFQKKPSITELAKPNWKNVMKPSDHLNKWSDILYKTK